MAYAIPFIFLGTLIATFVGALFALIAKKLKKEIITFLVNFSMGAMISLIFMELFMHSLHHTKDYFADAPWAGVLVVVSIVFASGLFFFLLHELLHKLTHHHNHDHNDNEPCHDHAHSTEIFNEKSLVYASFIFLVAIFIHNIPEGLALGITFNDVAESGIPINGIITSSILFIHNFIIGFTMCISFKSAKKSNSFSLLMTSISALPAVILGLVGYFIGQIEIGQNDLFKGIMLSISTGSLIYVLIVELIPQSFIEYKSKYTFIYTLFGIVINTILISLIH